MFLCRYAIGNVQPGSIQLQSSPQISNDPLIVLQGRIKGAERHSGCTRKIQKEGERYRHNEEAHFGQLPLHHLRGSERVEHLVYSARGP